MNHLAAPKKTTPMDQQKKTTVTVPRDTDPNNLNRDTAYLDCAALFSILGRDVRCKVAKVQEPLTYHSTLDPTFPSEPPRHYNFVSISCHQKQGKHSLSKTSHKTLWPSQSSWMLDAVCICTRGVLTYGCKIRQKILISTHSFVNSF